MTVETGNLIGFDVGGTSFRAGAVRCDGSLIGSAVDVPRRGDLGEQLLSHAIGMRAQAESAGVRVAGIGVAVPGPVGLDGVLRAAPSVPELTGLSAASLDTSDLKVLAFVNDANAALLAESRFGAAKGARNSIGLFLGTGVGGAMIVDAKVVIGQSGLAGEAGHLVLDPDGPPCGCGGHGCLEQLGSGSAVARWYSQQTGTPVTGAAEVAGLAEAGNSTARESFAVAGRWIGAAIASLANMMNPQAVVLGGGMMAAWPLFRNELLTTAERHVMAPIWHDLKIVPGSLGRAAGVIGAAEAARCAG